MNGYAARATWEPDQSPGSMEIGRSVKSFKASWRVPAPPSTDSGQTIYLFIGMETGSAVGDKVILQPVLQWGVHNLNHWGVATYCVSGSPGNLKFAATTKAMRVAPGDNLTASIVLQQKVGGTYGYLSEFVGIPESSLYINLPQELVQVGVALEVYRVMKLSDLPNSDVTRFSVVEIEFDNDAKGNPNWELANPELKYKIRAAPVMHGGVHNEIDIYYH
jgi:hypothetical protein